jgi:hypothetical protein
VIAAVNETLVVTVVVGGGFSLLVAWTVIMDRIERRQLAREAAERERMRGQRQR